MEYLSIKKKQLLIIIFFLTILSITGCTSTTNQKDKESINQENNQSNETVEQKTNEYVEDDIVNKFISNYNKITNYEISNITNGNIKTKYFGYSNDCYLEMINANENVAKVFSLTINGDNEESYITKIFEVYKYAIKTFDSSITDSQIEESINLLINDNTQYKFGDNILITYHPITEVSYGKTKCRIDIEVSNYK